MGLNEFRILALIWVYADRDYGELIDAIAKILTS
jgi:hypothetical protein